MWPAGRIRQRKFQAKASLLSGKAKTTKGLTANITSLAEDGADTGAGWFRKKAWSPCPFRSAILTGDDASSCLADPVRRPFMVRVVIGFPLAIDVRDGVIGGRIPYRVACDVHTDGATRPLDS